MTFTVEAKDRIAGVLCALAICAGVVLLAASQAGCGTTLKKQLNGINEGLSNTMPRAHETLKEDESAAIDACKASGALKTPANPNDLNAWAEQCPGFKKIWELHQLASKIARGIFVSIGIAAMYLAVDNEKGAKAIITNIVFKGIPMLKDTLAKAGFLELMGL